MAFNLMDVFVLAILVICVISCYKKGLVKSLFGMFSVLIALLIAINFSASVGSLLKSNEKFYDFVYSGVADTIDFGSHSSDNSQVEDSNELSLEELNSVLNAFSIDIDDSDIANLKTQAELIRQVIMPNLGSNNRILSYEKVNEIVAIYITNLIFSAIAAALVFVVALLILNVVSNVLNLVAHLPVLNIMNKLGGALIGLVQGFIIIWIIVMIINLLPINGFMISCYDLVETSRIAVLFK